MVLLILGISVILFQPVNILSLTPGLGRRGQVLKDRTLPVNRKHNLYLFITQHERDCGHAEACVTRTLDLGNHSLGGMFLVKLDYQLVLLFSAVCTHFFGDRSSVSSVLHGVSNFVGVIRRLSVEVDSLIRGLY